MIDSRIYIADQRGFTSLKDGVWFYSTLNYMQYKEPERGTISTLLHINEWVGEKAESIQLETSVDTFEIFLPIIASVKLQIANEIFSVEVGELFVLPSSCSTPVVVLTAEDFAFHQIVFQGDVKQHTARKYHLPILEKEMRNKMLSVFHPNNYPFDIYLGAYFTKEESVLQVSEDYKQTFSYVLDGSFEVEKRLLFAGDGLSMTHIHEIEMECLSATGLIMLFTF